MIKNDRQLAVARTKHSELLSAAGTASASDRKVWLALADEVAGEIDDYELVRAGHRRLFELCSIDDLGDALVRARIAKGLTQRELAERLGVAEQMVQRDEQGGYERASVTRIADVVDALEYTFFGRLQPTGEADSPVTTVNGPTVLYAYSLNPAVTVQRTTVDFRQEGGSTHQQHASAK